MINPRVWDHELKTGKLKKRLYKGIPDAVRGEVWSRLLHIQKTKAEQKDKYEVNNLSLDSYIQTNIHVN